MGEVSKDDTLVSREYDIYELENVLNNTMGAYTFNITGQALMSHLHSSF